MPIPNVYQADPRRLALLLDPNFVEPGARVPNAPAAGPWACRDRFEVLGLLGAGGMGVVLAARDRRTNRSVAVKVLRPQWLADRRAVAQFLTEARHMAHLRHPHVLPVLEVVNHPQGPYYVMPWLQRGSLARRLAPGRPLARATVLAIAQQVAAALRYAHEAGLIHRDLKPDNVLMDEQDHAYLADFGLVRTMFNDALVDVQGNQYIGTAAYMSPTVAAGQAEDTRCDIYAFGALLYELLTGRPPYQGKGSRDILRQVREGPPAPIRRWNPRADPHLIGIAEGAIARALRDRYAHMADLVADLERVARGQEPLGPHGRPPAASRRWVGRLLTFTAGIALAAGIALFGFSLRKPRIDPALPPMPSGNSWHVRSTIRVTSRSESYGHSNSQSTQVGSSSSQSLEIVP
jgi:serine/threonine protein kinase